MRVATHGLTAILRSDIYFLNHFNKGNINSAHTVDTIIKDKMQVVGIHNLEANIIVAGLLRSKVLQVQRLQYEEQLLLPLITAYDDLLHISELSRNISRTLVVNKIRDWWYSSWFTTQIIQLRDDIMADIAANLTAMGITICRAKKQKIIVSGLCNIDFTAISRKIKDKYGLMLYCGEHYSIY